MADNKIYAFSSLIGGSDESYLDYFDGNDLVDGDFAFGLVDGIQYAYKLDASSGATENSPRIISPDTNAGTKRWVLQVPGGDFSHVYASRLTLPQSIPTNTSTTLTYEYKETDTLGEFNISTGEFIPKFDGFYNINACVRMSYQTWPSYSECYLQTFLDGSLWERGPSFYPGNGSNMVTGSASLSQTLSLGVGYRLTIRCYHTFGSAISAQGYGGTWLTIDRLP